MNIEWLGSTTFIIKNSIGKRVLLNPLESTNNFEEHCNNATVITLNDPFKKIFVTNKNNFEHKIINNCSTYSNDFLTVKSYLTFKDKMNGIKRGGNIIYILELDGLRFCHLGLLGHKLSYDLIEKLGKIDFLFIPIGGHFCLNGLEASKLTHEITPKYVIPMYYKNSSNLSYLDNPRKFISYFKNVITHKESSIQSSSLPFDSNNVVLLLK